MTFLGDILSFKTQHEFARKLQRYYKSQNKLIITKGLCTNKTFKDFGHVIYDKLWSHGMDTLYFRSILARRNSESDHEKNASSKLFPSVFHKDLLDPILFTIFMDLTTIV